MSNGLIERAHVQDIADAIREKNGTENTYTPAQMGDAIRSIPSGGGGFYPSLTVYTDTGATVTAQKMKSGGGTPVSTLIVGDTVKINVDGTPTEFLVVHQGKPSSIYDDSCNGTWLLMKDCYESRQWHSSNVNDYANSTIHSYLNGTFKSLFDSDIQSKMLTVKLPYRSGSGYGKTVTSGANGLSATIFLLSATEVGLTGTDYNPTDEGVTLSYFSGTASNGTDSKRVANLNGSATLWWLRSPYCNSSYGASYALFVNAYGNWNLNDCSNSYGIRPALVLDSSAMVDDDGNIVDSSAKPDPSVAPVTLEEVSNGLYWGELTDYGEWEATATLDGETSSDDLLVEAVENYGLTLDFIPPIPENVNDATWEQISEISQAGTGADYWAVGDAKEITLNGTVGTQSYSNVKLCVFILHFNMPTNKSTAENNIIWGGFKTALTGGVDVCLDDANYNGAKYDGTKCYNMNHWGTSSGNYNTNFGGWAACDLRYDILGAVSTAPSPYGSTKTTGASGSNATTAAITSPVADTLMAALPSDFRAVLRLWTRWVDNKGNSSNVDANVTSIVDAGISLLTEFEVIGIRDYANLYEQNHQVQCAYYANGNSRIKYLQSSTGTAAFWFFASANGSNAFSFCRGNLDGRVGHNGSRVSYGLAPAFKT